MMWILTIIAHVNAVITQDFITIFAMGFSLLDILVSMVLGSLGYRIARVLYPSLPAQVMILQNEKRRAERKEEYKDMQLELAREKAKIWGETKFKRSARGGTANPTNAAAPDYDMDKIVAARIAAYEEEHGPDE